MGRRGMYRFRSRNRRVVVQNIKKSTVGCEDSMSDRRGRIEYPGKPRGVSDVFSKGQKGRKPIGIDSAYEGDVKAPGKKCVGDKGAADGVDGRIRRADRGNLRP